MIPIPDPPVTASAVSARLRAIVADYCGEDVEITDASTWEALGLDSLDLASIEIDVEHAFRIPAHRLTEGRGSLPPTFGELAAAIYRLTAGAGP